MTAFALLECDVDDCDRKSDQGAPDLQTARRWAKQDGWTKFGAEDYCPDHAQLAANKAREMRVSGRIG